jgi:hypothetical protein
LRGLREFKGVCKEFLGIRGVYGINIEICVYLEKVV